MGSSTFCDPRGSQNVLDPKYLPPMFSTSNSLKLSAKDLRVVIHSPPNLYIGGYDSNIYTLNPQTFTVINTQSPNISKISSLLKTTYPSLLICGSHTGQIAIYTDINDTVPNYLTGHTANVSTLASNNNILVTGSWDNTVRIWNLTNYSETHVFSMNNCVWCACFIDNDTNSSKNDFVVGTADGYITIFRKFAIQSDYKIHIQAVRGVIYRNGSIISVGNDGKVIKCTVNGMLEKVVDLKEFIFKISSFKDEYVVVVGENGRIVCMDYELNVLYDDKLNPQTCWDCVGDDDGIVVVGSDGTVYRLKPESKDKNLKNEIDTKIDANITDNVNYLGKYENIKDSSITNQSRNQTTGTIKEGIINNKVVDINAKSNDVNSRINEIDITGKSNKEKSKGDVTCKDPNYKIMDNKVYFFTNGEWSLIGDVVDEEKKYDHSFSVEVDNRTLQIQFNENENIHDVADNFLIKNNLSNMYRDQIVEFIAKNFTPKSNFYKYKTIDLSAIKQLLKDNNTIIKNLEKPDITQNEEVESELKKLLKNEVNFFVIDCYRYLHYKGFKFDFCFLQTYDTSNKKNATMFLRLVCNLLSDMPYAIEVLDAKINSIFDRGLVDDMTKHNYGNNRDLLNKK